jgi:hypothetical protein
MLREVMVPSEDSQITNNMNTRNQALADYMRVHRFKRGTSEMMKRVSLD